MAAFDFPRFANKDAWTPELIAYHQKNLEQQGVRFGRDSFGMVDVHSQETTLTIRTTDLDLSGGVDAGVIPYGVSVRTAGA